jgi:hypothetical protein
MRHTGQWWEIFQGLSLEECFEEIKRQKLFHPWILVELLPPVQEGLLRTMLQCHLRNYGKGIDFILGNHVIT